VYGACHAGLEVRWYVLVWHAGTSFSPFDSWCHAATTSSGQMYKS